MLLKYMIQKGYVNVSKVLLSIYPQIGLDAKEVLVVLKLFEMLKNNQVTISLNDLSKKMVMSVDETSNILASLLEKDLLTFVESVNKDGKSKEIFNLDNLISRIEQYFETEIKSIDDKNNQNLTKQLINLVEETFKRGLTNLEIEMIIEWAKENQSCEKVRKALAQAVRLNKLNIKYVDACLANMDSTSDFVLDDNKSKLLADLYRNIK